MNIGICDKKKSPLGTKQMNTASNTMSSEYMSAMKIIMKLINQIFCDKSKPILPCMLTDTFCKGSNVKPGLM